MKENAAVTVGCILELRSVDNEIYTQTTLG